MVVIQLPSRVETVRQDFTVTTLGKAHAFPAVQENLVILLVLLNVNLVPKIRITVTKEEIRVAFHVMMVRRRKKVARNVKRVVRVHMAMGVKIVPKVKHVMAVTMLLLRVVIILQVITLMTWVKDLVCRVFRK